MQKCVLLGVALSLAAPALAGGSFVFEDPTFDRWNYPFNSTPGQRDFASTFGSGFVPGLFDDRDAQFLNTYNTATQIQAGLGAQNYVITSARLTATIDPRFGGVFNIDTTYDGFNTYRQPFEPGFAPDTDAGRPVELYGTGFRNGFTAQTFGDSAPWSFTGPTAEDARNAFALDFDGAGNARDVSNNVRDGFDTNPFAIGRVEGLGEGEFVPGGANVIFDLSVQNAFVQQYLAEGLNAGWLSLSISSLHSAVQGGPIEFPAFVTNETLFPGLSGASLELEVQIIPTPGSMGVIALGGLVALRRRR